MVIHHIQHLYFNQNKKINNRAISYCYYLVFLLITASLKIQQKQCGEKMYFMRSDFILHQAPPSKAFTTSAVVAMNRKYNFDSLTHHGDNLIKFLLGEYNLSETSMAL